MKQLLLPTKGDVFRVKSRLKCSFDDALACAMVELIVDQNHGKKYTEKQLKNEIKRRLKKSGYITI